MTKNLGSQGKTLYANAECRVFSRHLVNYHSAPFERRPVQLWGRPLPSKPHPDKASSINLQKRFINMQLRNKQDFWSGVMFVALGIGFALGATNYSMGTAARMGPGYFPFWLGVCLAVLGATVAIGALKEKAEATEVERFDFRILFIIIGSVVFAGVVLNILGIYLTVFLLVVLSSLASHEFSWKVAVTTGIFLVVFVWLAFIKGLGLIFPLWPSFI